MSVAEENQVENQVEKPVEDNQKLVWVSLYGGTGLFQWNHTEDAVTSEPALAHGGGVGINFRVVDWLEVSTGARVSFFSPEMKVDDYNVSMMAVDNEGDEYEKRISASRIVEEQEFVWAGFPLSIRYVFNPGRWDLYAEAGGEYCLALKSSFDQTGRFSHHGYYSEYDLYIDDLPSNGFYDEKTLTSIGELDPESFIMPFVAAGLVFPGEAALFFIEGRYYMPGNDPFSEKQDLLFEGPLNNESVFTFSNESVMKSGKVTLSGFRGVIGIRF
ncbi:MAG: hypothetical protein ACOCTO_02235 [Marinilabiliaceae bacterium]